MIKMAKGIGVAVALFSSSAALADDSGWVISEADGQVSISRGDKSVYGAKGTRLQIGDIIRTSKSARAVLVRDKEFFIVSPNKKIRVVKSTKKGAVAQVVDFLGGMFGGDSQHSKLNRPMDAAVVKGYGSEFSGQPATQTSSEEDSAVKDD